MMKAMILAAGEGTRLKPHTLRTPKVLLPIGGTPLIEYTLGWLKSYGISQVAINLYHLGEKIRDFLGDGSHLGMNIFYSPEETLLGTAGGVKKMQDFFSNTFVVVYGDVLTNFDLGAMVKFHRVRNPLATIAILKMLKPARSSEASSFGNGAVYVLEKRILDHVPSGEFSDFACDIFPKLIKCNHPIYGYALKADDYLIDIGTLDRYRKANDDVKAGKVELRLQENRVLSGR